MRLDHLLSRETCLETPILVSSKVNQVELPDFQVRALFFSHSGAWPSVALYVQADARRARSCRVGGSRAREDLVPTHRGSELLQDAY